MEVLWVLLAIPSLSLAQVVISPAMLVVSISGGGNGRFICHSISEDSIVRIQWLMNGSATLTNEAIASENVIVLLDDGAGVLDIINVLLEFNGTSIQCNSLLTSGTNSTTEPATLLLQGLLSAVGSLRATLHDSIISLTWTAPFTLDIRDADPDITYCVGVVNSTSSSTLNSECGITETEYEYPIPPDSACHGHMVTVIPVNLAGNGASSTQEVLHLPQVNDTAIYYDASVIHIVTSAPVCSGELKFVDLDTGEIIKLGNGELTIAEINITFAAEQLRVNRRYNVTVRASNSAGSTTSYVTISTHDILNATTTETDDDAIVITTLYSEHSDARGALFDFVFIDDNGDVDFTRSALLALDRNTSLHHTLPFNLYPGQYRVFVYDIESDGTLSNGVGYPADELYYKFEDQLLTSSINGQEYLNNCSLTFSSGLILAECSPMNGALVTGFQMIAQLNDSSEVHKLHVNQSIDLQTPVTVEVEETGMYQVAIFAIREGTGIVGSYVVYTGNVQAVVGDFTSYATDSTTNMTDPTGTTIVMILMWTCAGLGTALVLISIVTSAVIIVQCHTIKTLTSKGKIRSACDLTKTEELTVANQESQLYEEIGDMNTPTSTGNIGVSSSAPGTGTAAARAQYEYEDVKPVGSDVAKSSDPYDITLCSAYGVALSLDD